MSTIKTDDIFPNQPLSNDATESKVKPINKTHTSVGLIEICLNCAPPDKAAEK